MLYAEKLSASIKNSKMTLTDICDSMNLMGYSTHKGYLSKLQNGKLPPAGEEFNRAIAEVLGINADELVIAGYVEKAPEEVRELIQHYADRLDNYTKIVAAFFVGDIEEIGEEQWKSDVNKILEKFGEVPFEEKFDYIINNFNRIVLSQPDFFRRVGRDSGVSDDRIEHTISSIKDKPVNRIDVWDLKTDKRTFDWVSTEKIRYGEYIYVIAPDDSMNGSMIINGVRVLCRILEQDYREEDKEVLSGKIYLVMYEGCYMLRRVFLQDGQPTTLQSSNEKYAPIIVSNPEEFSVYAIVTQIEFNPNDERILANPPFGR